MLRNGAPPNLTGALGIDTSCRSGAAWPNTFRTRPAIITASHRIARRQLRRTVQDPEQPGVSDNIKIRNRQSTAPFVFCPLPPLTV